MRRLTGEIIGVGLLTGAVLTGCGSSGDGKADQPTETVVPTGVETKDMSGLPPKEMAMDDDWKLTSITGVGESELTSDGDWGHEASVFRFNFELGGTAISCIVATDSGADFPDNQYLDPGLCFVNGDLTKPLTSLSTQP